jgi:hypothetical protein
MAIRPEDVLADGVDAVDLDGRAVRKGSVAAFVANARALEEQTPDTEEYDATVAALRELAGDLRALRIFDVLAIRSPQLAAIVGEND